MVSFNSMHRGAIRFLIPTILLFNNIIFCFVTNPSKHASRSFPGSRPLPSSVSGQDTVTSWSALYDKRDPEYGSGDNQHATQTPPSELSFGLTDDEFVSWLTAELSDAPGRYEYEKTFDNAILAMVKWRQRFRGNPAVWKRIFKKERVFKELIESAPVLDLVQSFVDDSEKKGENEKITILDLCSGKGYLSMFLSEILPPEKVSKLILIDRAWPMCNGEILPHHMNWDHIYGDIPRGDGILSPEIDLDENPTYFTTWPIPLHTSKQDLKQSCNQRQMKKYIFDRTEGPILILAVHLCGTLSLKAIDFFNNHENVKMFCLKPCCLPGMVHAKRHDTFRIGRHSFPAEDVCSNGSFTKKDWSGPPRWHLQKKFELWSDNLYQGIDINGVDDDVDDVKRSGRKAKREVQVQVDGGFQNTYLLAERTPVTADLWN